MHKKSYVGATFGRSRAHKVRPYVVQYVKAYSLS